jgi:hypothetical protein
VGTYLVVTGSGGKGGNGYQYAHLPVAMESDIRSATLRDLTGNGKKELITRIRQRTEQGSVELWQVRSLAGEKPRLLLTIQVRIERPGGYAEAGVRIVRGKRRKPPAIVLSADKAPGLDPRRFRNPRFANVEPLLLPWDPVEERIYRWDGQRFDVEKERENPRVAVSQQQVGPAAGRESRGSGSAGGGLARPTLERLIAAVRESRGIPESERPRFKRKANLAEDRQKETLVVIGRALAVMGPGFRGGTGYFSYGIPVQDPSDVLSVKTADLTGDGRDEVLVRVRHEIGDLKREVVIVHQFTDRGFRRLLGVEVKREQGTNVIGNKVRLLRRGRRRVLEVRAGRARGWSADTYPFVAQPSDPIEPLRLPWNHRQVRYRFDGDRLVGRR